MILFTGTKSHILESFNQDFKAINAILIDSIDVVNKQFEILANIHDIHHDIALDNHKRIKCNDKKLEELVIKTIALKNPVANDLKSLMISLKVSHELASMSHYCKNAIVKGEEIDFNQYKANDLNDLINNVHVNFNDAMRLFHECTDGLMHKIISRESDIDKQYGEYIESVLQVAQNAQNDLIALILLVKDIEKIADHAEKIAYIAYNFVVGIDFHM